MNRAFTSILCSNVGRVAQFYQDLLGMKVHLGTENSLHRYAHSSRGDAFVKDDRLYLYHMLERCDRIARFIGPGREGFMESEELQDAVIRNVEVIGEAAKGSQRRRGAVWRHSIGRRSAGCATC